MQLVGIAPILCERLSKPVGSMWRSATPLTASLLIIVSLLASCIRGQGFSTVSAPQTQDPSQIADCLRNSLQAHRLFLSCSAEAQSLNITTRDALTCVLRRCLTPSKTEPVKILAAQSTYSKLISAATAVYSQVTEVPIVMDAQPARTSLQTTAASITNAANRNATHEAWITWPQSFGDGLSQGAFKGLSALVEFDQRLNWLGLMPSIRLNALLFQSQVLALPLSVTTYHLAYRKDMFAKYNWTVPRTWRELVSFATQVNGTGGMHSLCGQWSPCFHTAVILMRYVLATMVQTHGATQGWLFEPESMALMLKSAAMKEALDIIMGLYKVSAPDMSMALGCPSYGIEFTTGQCLMSIMHPYSYKYSSHPSSPGWNSVLRGNLGLAPWPGSDVVIDVPTDTLVPCDPKRCPFASRQVREDGSEYYMNESPGQEVMVATINAHASEFRSFFAFSALSYVASPDVSETFVFDPKSELFPTRLSMLDPELWVAAGFDHNNSLAFCRDTLRALQHPNVHTAFPGRGSTQLLLHWIDVSHAMLATGSISHAFIQLGIQADATLSQLYGDNATALKLEYWQSINRVYKLSDSNPSRPLAYPNEPSPSEDSLPLAAIIVPIVAVVALAASLAWLYVRTSGGKFMGQVRHPGPGPKTTLLVTDIENSTSLWEQLDPSTVDAAVKMHNACIRTLAAEHLGYESVWEGDSFIIAFPTPKAAVQFAVQAQLQLMKLNWPAGLLASEVASEVWAVAVKTGKKLSLPPQSIGMNPESSAMRRTSTVGSGGLGLTPSNGPLDTNLPSKSNTSYGGPEDDSGCANEIPAIQTEQSGLSSAPDSPLRGGATATGTLWFQSQWQVCGPKAPGAVCLLRGLRVRIGLHAGVAGASDIQFNAHMRRWHYTGPTRVTSNAVASAGHGGCIMLSSSTASLLGTDAAGVLTDLPSNCQIYHMGTHVLNGVEDPTDLLMVLPTALRGRLAVQQEPLRSVKCVLPGILDTPVGGSEQHGGLSAVGVQVSSLGTLLHWNAAITRQAIRTTLACFQDVLIKTGGTLVEDGLSLVLTTGKTRLPVGAALPDMTVPGRLLSVFTQPSSAVQFALQLRQAMTKLDWDTELLQHELCERVGQVEPALLSTSKHFSSITTADEYERDNPDLETSSQCRSVESPDRPRPKRGSTTGKLTASPRVSFATLPAGNPLSQAGKPSLSSSMQRKSHGRVSSRPSARALLNLLRGLDVVEVSVSDEQETSSNVTGSDTKEGPTWKADEAAHGKLTASLKGSVHVIKPILLRGLRTRTTVVQGPMHLTVATRSSGRVVYTGKAIKKLTKVLERLKAGEVAVESHVFNQLAPGRVLSGQSGQGLPSG